MSTEIGIVGKPSSGKSSLFKATNMIDVPIADYPFTTIKPNIGLGYVITSCVCKEFNVKCNPKNSLCIDGERQIPVKLIDVAGLVPGAHIGKGMGNQFLDDLRQTSCLIHVVDASGTTDAEGKTTVGYDPLEDVEFVVKEIDLWFAEIVRRGLAKYEKKRKTTKVEVLDVLADQLTGLGISRENINETLNEFGIADVDAFASELRKISKPIIVAANKIDLPTSEKNFEKMKEKFSDFPIIPTSAAAEIALKTAEKKGIITYEKNNFTIKDESKLDSKQLGGLNFIRESVLEKYGSTGIQKCLNEAVFGVLGYIVVYPVANASRLTDTKGNILPDAFLVRTRTTLKEFAAEIHSDIAENFIGGMDARTKKKLGANYELKNNDVVEILFRG